MNPRTDDMDRLAEAERWADAQTFRHGGRRAEDRGMALAVHAGLQMVRDHGPDTVPVQQNSAEGCADPDDIGHPRVPRRRPLLTPAGRLWVGYFTALGAIAAAVFLIRR